MGVRYLACHPTIAMGLCYSCSSSSRFQLSCLTWHISSTYIWTGRENGGGFFCLSRECFEYTGPGYEIVYLLWPSSSWGIKKQLSWVELVFINRCGWPDSLTGNWSSLFRVCSGTKELFQFNFWSTNVCYLDKYVVDILLLPFISWKAMFYQGVIFLKKTISQLVLVFKNISTRLASKPDRTVGQIFALTVVFLHFFWIPCSVRVCFSGGKENECFWRIPCLTLARAEKLTPCNSFPLFPFLLFSPKRDWRRKRRVFPVPCNYFSYTLLHRKCKA